MGEDSKKDVRDHVQECRDIVLAVQVPLEAEVVEDIKKYVREDVQDFRDIVLAVQVLSAAAGG